MNQELLGGAQQRSATLSIDQPRALQALECLVDLGRAQCQVGGDLGDYRPVAAIADQLDEQDDILGEQALGYSIF